MEIFGENRAGTLGNLNSVCLHKPVVGSPGERTLPNTALFRTNMGKGYRIVPGRRSGFADYLHTGFSPASPLRSELKMDAFHRHLPLANAGHVLEHGGWARTIQKRGLLHVLPRHETVRRRFKGPRQQDTGGFAL